MDNIKKISINNNEYDIFNPFIEKDIIDTYKDIEKFKTEITSLINENKDPILLKKLDNIEVGTVYSLYSGWAFNKVPFNELLFVFDSNYEYHDSYTSSILDGQSILMPENWRDPNENYLYQWFYRKIYYKTINNKEVEGDQHYYGEFTIGIYIQNNKYDNNRYDISFKLVNKPKYYPTYGSATTADAYFPDSSIGPFIIYGVR